MPSLASAAEDMTDLMIWDVLRMAPLFGDVSVLLERKKCLPAWLHDFGFLRYEALLWMLSIMLLFA